MTFSYLLKKTERLTSALYLITGFVERDEPLCRLIRSQGLAVLSQTHDFARDAAPAARQRLRAAMQEAVSLLGVADDVGVVSHMNATLVAEEYVALMSDLDSVVNPASEVELRVSGIAKRAASHWRQAVPQRAAQDAPGGSMVQYEGLSDFLKDTGGSDNLKDTLKTSEKNVLETKGSFRSAGKDHASELHKGHKSDLSPSAQRQRDRRALILQLLQEHPAITVKDVKLNIENCSEKTIQRELLTMVDQGVLKKRGERRWSTYSLA